MAKKRVSERKKELKKIDNIPKCSHQRRSSPPKRRTDFSSFFCNSFSISDSGSLLGSSCGKVLLSNNDFSSLHERRNAQGKEFFQSSLVHCSKSQEEGSGFSSNSTEASILEVELVDQHALLESCDDRFQSFLCYDLARYHQLESSIFQVNDFIFTLCREVGKDASDDLGILDYTPNKSYIAERKALILQWEDHQISSREFVKRTAASNHSDEFDLSSNKSTLSVSSRTEDDILERGRGKRERKPKLHFDDITFPLKPERKVRRLRIMRYLGLTPPVGSPF